MKNSVFILTEQRQAHDESRVSAIIQQAVTAWLTKELSQSSLSRDWDEQLHL